MNTTKPRFPWASLIGLVLLVVLIWQVDYTALIGVFRQAALPLLLLAVLLNIPMLALKTWRWRLILRSQQVDYAIGKAFLAYLGSIFIGLVTPGRLGEFVKMMHVTRDCGVTSARAFSSVLVDRLFDLGMLMLFGGAALLTLGHAGSPLLSFALSVIILAFPFVLFLHPTTFGYMQHMGVKMGRIGTKLFAPDGWVVEMRQGMRELSVGNAVASALLTIAAYAVFFCQCYILALALDMQVGFLAVSYTIALGSLVTLLPISISGLGTREATIIAYLHTLHVPNDLALGFSLLVFGTFYLAGGMMGAVAWWIKPVPLGRRV